MHKQLYLLFITIFSLFYFHQNVSAATNHLVISEIQIAGNTAEDEFVELYNPTDNSLDLTNYRLTKKTASGAQSNLVSNLTGTIPAHGYFLIAHPNYTGTTNPDLTYSAASNSLATNNSVILYSDPGITQVDLVGWGTTTISESAPAPNPTTDTTLNRTDNLDTDNNGFDFSLTNPNPNNSSFVTPSPSPSPSASPLPSVLPSPTPNSTPTPTPTPAPSNNIFIQTRYLTCYRYFIPHPTRFRTLMTPRISCHRN